MTSSRKERIVHLTKDDFVFTACRGHGKGGQHRNTSDTAVRCSHPPSGATAISQDERSQLMNKRTAFRRMAQTKKFRTWLLIETAKRMGRMKSDAELMQQVMREIEDPTITKVEYL